jgi:polysaccharide biosynthesis/export protein
MKAIRLFFIISIIILVCVVVSVAQTVPANNGKITTPNLDNNADNERYRIGFQDTLEIQVFRHPELNQRVNVNPDGTIFLFRTDKPIAAVCKTERELANVVAQEYLSFLKKPEINVVAIEKKSQSLGVIGAVEKPGTFFVNRKIRLLELLAFAGGTNKEAGSRLIVARTGSTSACKIESDDSVIQNDLLLMNFKVKDVLEGKQNLWMQPGDVVSVLDSDVIYIYGNVKKVGAVKMREPITLTQAIVSAEGLKPTAKSQVKVLRQKQDSSEREELVFNLKDIESRKIQDPFLEPNDIVAVSEDSKKVILKGIKDIIQQGIPGVIYKL